MNQIISSKETGGEDSNALRDFIEAHKLHAKLSQVTIRAINDQADAARKRMATWEKVKGFAGGACFVDGTYLYQITFDGQIQALSVLSL